MRTMYTMLLIVQYSSAQFGGGGFGGLGGGLGSSCCCCCCPCPCPLPPPPSVFYVNPCPAPTTGSPVGVPDVVVGPCGEVVIPLYNPPAEALLP